MDLLDFKLKVPLHLNHPLSNKNNPPPLLAGEESLSNKKIDDDTVLPPPAALFQLFLSNTLAINICCVICLMPLIMESLPMGGHTNRQQFSGCLYLIISPLTIPSVLFFNLHHKNSRKITFALAISAIILGNLTAIIYCSQCVSISGSAEVAIICLSLSLVLGTFQLLMLINKNNIAIVMISTASSVVVWGLAITALFVPSNITRRCYQSTIPCILWLFWQAMRNQQCNNCNLSEGNV